MTLLIFLGSFNLMGAGVTQFMHLIVEGRNLDSHRASAPTTNSAATGLTMSLCSTPAAASSATPTTHGQHFLSSSPFFRSIIAPKRTPSFNLKVVKGKMHRNGRKIEFQPVHQIFIKLVDSTANVEHILAIIRRRWGPDHILVTQDGLPLEDDIIMHVHVCVCVCVLVGCIVTLSCWCIMYMCIMFYVYYIYPLYIREYIYIYLGF